MLMGVFIFSIWFVGFVCGALFMRFCARRGVGEMSLCNGCRYKNLWAEATAEIAEDDNDEPYHTTRILCKTCEYYKNPCEGSEEGCTKCY